MTKVILVRHGEVAGNAGDKMAFVGWSDPALTAVGEKQSHAVADYLSSETVAAVYSSDLQRARITADRIAARHDLSPVVDPDLREVNYGAWEGLGASELLRDWPQQWTARQSDPWNVAAVDGESYSTMWARFFPRWQALVNRHKGECVVLVGHNGLIRMLICHLLGAPFDNFKRIHVSNCGVSRVEIEGELPVVRSINDTHFLA
jgi:alpha-ribazole phosphatase